MKTCFIALHSFEILAAMGLFMGGLGCSSGSPLEEMDYDDPEPVGVAISGLTVAEAVNQGCSTMILKNLSLQIIAQGQCINPDAFVEVPKVANISFGSTVFPYLELPAKDALLKALASKPNTQMTVNSMLRTVAQQYLLYTWYLNGQCNIALAAKPGASNHETGLALDVSEYNTWMTALENNGFNWLGNSDVVHFDYAGPGAVNYKGLDVKAFQQLWNINHPNDLIDEDGIYGPQTEARLKQSPADGFAIGPNCPAPKPSPDLFPAIVWADAEDRFSDHSSAGIIDWMEGDSHSVYLSVSNKGGEGASNADIGILVDEPFVEVNDYLIESDWQNGGVFQENDANSDPANPVHSQALGKAFSLKLNGISPGETKRVTLSVQTAAYSIGLADSPGIRFWVKDIPNFYHQDDYDGPATNVDGSQSFGDKLQVNAPSDIYSRTHWEWDSDRLEGWEARNQVSVVADASLKTLLIEADGDDPGAMGPETAFAAKDFHKIVIRAKRNGGTGASKLYFSTVEDPVMDELKSQVLELPAEGSFREVILDMSAHPHWTGTVNALRIDPFDSGLGTMELDYVRVLSGVSNGNNGPGNGAAPEDNSLGSSCICAFPGSAGRHLNGAGWLFSLSYLLLVLRRKGRV